MSDTDAGSRRHPASIAPYALVRVATVAHPPGPAATLPFRDAVNALADKESEVAAIATELVVRLHDSAATHSVEFHHKVVLPLRRDVHNGRAPRPSLLAALGSLPARIPLLARWLAARVELSERAAEVLRLWPRALAAERATLAELCAAEPLRRAAVLSGRDLVHGLDRAARGGGDRRARKAEPTILRYALRATTKTSPFSWYTAVGWGVWSDVASIEGAPVAHARVNHVLIARLTAALLRDPARREHLPHRLAPALRERDSRVVFRRDVPVAGAARAYLVQEETVDVAATAPLRFLIDAVASASPKGISPAELSALLATRLPNGGVEHAARFVARLLDIGVLVPVAPIDRQEPDASEALSGWLRDIQEPDLAERLTVLNRQTIEFATLDVKARAGRLVELEESWRDLGVDPVGVSPLSEDVVLPATVPVRRTEATTTLSRLTPLLMLFDRQLLIRRITRNLFVERFGAGGSARPADCAELLQSALVAAMTIAPGTDEHINALLAARARLAAMIPADGSIPDTAVEAAEDLLPAWATRRPVSYSFFAQPLPDDSLVVNHIYAGFGRFASRFLDWLPAEARATLAGQLERMSGDLAQFRPVAGFNANLHPMVTGQEVGEDPRWADLTPEQLEVHHDPASDEIRLRRLDTGEPVDVLYLGFLMPLMLPDRFAALYADLACGWPDLAELRSTSDSNGSVHKGRLRYRDVVLERRSWEFDGERLRAELAGDEATIALAAARLRARYGLPGQVFVGAGGAITSRADFEARLGAPKPQYMDLANALHLRCLPRLLSRYDGRIQVTEALPVPDGQVIELIAETYRRAS